MLRNEVKTKSRRKPLKDLSNKNCERSSKSVNLVAVSQKHNKENTPKVVEDDNVLDQLLLVQSNLSSLVQQVSLHFLGSWDSRLHLMQLGALNIYMNTVQHTETHYVRQDMKTSNILLDGSFRAKISDFGLAKHVGKTNDGEITVTLYLSDGLATTKTDVYAFGVVPFEIIIEREAIIQTEGTMTKNPERCSLASIMLAALRNSSDSMSMLSLRDYINPNMMDLYPHDCVLKMAILVKQCVGDNPILRSDMKTSCHIPLTDPSLFY